jgi:hypothetical protein
VLGALVGAPAHLLAATEPPAVSAARALMEEGVKLYDAGEYAAALDRFEQARAMVRFPTVGLMSARALEKLGRLVEASERYLAVSQTVPESNASAAQRDAPIKAAREREALLPRIPVLEIRVGGASAGSARVTVDGTALREEDIGRPYLVDPGHHHVEASRGDRRAAKDVDLGEGARKEVLLDLIPALDAWRPLGIAALGVGGAAIFVGVVTGAVVLSTEHDLYAKGCANATGPPPLTGEVNRYNALRIVSSTGLVGGAALAGAGAAIFLLVAKRGPATARGPAKAPAISPWIGSASALVPALAGVQGEF